MSNTTQALEHARLLHRAGQHHKAGQWVRNATEFIHQDLVLPDHISADAGPIYLRLRCNRCTGSMLIGGLSTAADFRDEHWHCGEEQADVWLCPHCTAWSFAWQGQCRFCETEAVGNYAGRGPVVDLLNYLRWFDVYKREDVVASVRCRSLQRAKRAAGAMYPHEEVRIVSPFGSWTVGPSV